MMEEHLTLTRFLSQQSAAVAAAAATRRGDLFMPPPHHHSHRLLRQQHPQPTHHHHQYGRAASGGGGGSGGGYVSVGSDKRNRNPNWTDAEIVRFLEILQEESVMRDLLAQRNKQVGCHSTSCRRRYHCSNNNSIDKNSSSQCNSNNSIIDNANQRFNFIQLSKV